MHQLQCFAISDLTHPLTNLDDPADIGQHLSGIGVHFQRVTGCEGLVAGTAPAVIQTALAPAIASMCAQGGFQSVDVVSVTPQTPGIEAMRTRFLAEHVHVEDEARLMVAGAGLFYLRVDGQLTVLRLQAGELISVPAGMRHWFDMGLTPAFTAVRFFTRPDSWVAQFTGDPIAGEFAAWPGAASSAAGAGNQSISHA